MTTSEPSRVWSSSRSDFAHVVPHGVAAKDVLDSRYEVIRPIATGGMGEILEARHQLTGRTVVLKIVRRELASRPDVIARLQREAHALGAIQHPGIVEILDSGHCGRHGPYIVLEKLEGRALDGLLAARGTLGAEGAMTILRALATSLAEVHRRGYVHRDLKPGNVFVASSRIKGEHVKLLDFGVVGESTPSSAKHLTLAGDLLGTLGYMAPEQLADVTVADPRSDLYALALVVLECLGVGAEDFSRVRRESRPATITLAGRSDVTAGVVTLLDDMLAFSLRDRPASADAVLERMGDVGHPPIALLGGYAAPEVQREAPTQCEPAMRRAQPAPALAAEGAAPDARRRQLRAPYITPVRVVGSAEHVDGRSEDISAGGMLVVVEGKLTGHGAVVVRFALPTTGHVVAVRATSKWMREQNGRTAVGLEFDAMDAATCQAIESYVRYLAVER